MVKIISRCFDNENNIIYITYKKGNTTYIMTKRLIRGIYIVTSNKIKN